jgi:cytochrome P450 family 6
LTLEGQEWKDRRVKLSPIFTSGKIKMMFEIVDSIGDKLIETVDKEIAISENTNVQTFLGRYSTVSL